MSAILTAWRVEDVLDAAVQTLINGRCRQAYVHDMRGGLQAVHSSVELLSRAAKRGGVDEARLTSIAGLAKRAMANQEQALIGIVNQITMPPEAASTFDLAQLLTDVQQFLRNDTAHKDIRFEIHAIPDATVSAPRAKLRSLLVGFVALCVDALPAGALLRADLARMAGHVEIEIRSGLSFAPVRNGADLMHHVGDALPPHELVLGALQRLALAHGGGVEFLPQQDPGVEVGATGIAEAALLRVRLPLAPP